jgi:hypothetical protein
MSDQLSLRETMVARVVRTQETGYTMYFILLVSCLTKSYQNLRDTKQKQFICDVELLTIKHSVG